MKYGFHTISPAKQKAIARKGGLANAARYNGCNMSTEDRRRGGKKGGTTTSKDRAWMRKIGSKGGKAAAKKRRG